MSTKVGVTQYFPNIPILYTFLHATSYKTNVQRSALGNGALEVKFQLLALKSNAWLG